MKIKSIILVLVILLLLGQSLSVNSQLHFRTGNTYLELSENEKMPYVAGLLDMWLFMYYYNYPDHYKIIYEKVKKIPPRQVKKIFEKYLEKNPEELHFVAARLFDLAMGELTFGGNNGK